MRNLMPYAVRHGPFTGQNNLRWKLLVTVREKREGRTRHLPPRPAAGDSTMPYVTDVP
jgi:hypothetical protein